jgi:predicted 3-demethylubiquinone-9 3-methyltransferase (glyoxalase superfamily)
MVTVAEMATAAAIRETAEISRATVAAAAKPPRQIGSNRSGRSSQAPASAFMRVQWFREPVPVSTDFMRSDTMQTITPFLWFNDRAEEAMNFYVSIFKNSKTVSISRYGDAGPGPKGSVMVAKFQLDGQEFLALNGGPMFTFSPAISFVVNCKTQEEVDAYWEKLSAGGAKSQCGWLTDRFGLSWQVVPTILGELVAGKDPEKSNRVMQAMLPMTKIDIATLKRAYENDPSTV